MDRAQNRVGVRDGRRAERHGDAEISHFNVAHMVDQNVVGLNIPVDNLVIMGMCDGGYDLLHDLDRFFRMKWACSIYVFFQGHPSTYSITI